MLLQGRDASDPLFLQVKEATASVLEGHLPRSRYRQHGQRVVQGQRLARGHARSGDPVAIAAYLGRGDAFDRAVTDFAERYADQNERDYEEFTAAIKSGRLTAAEGV